MCGISSQLSWLSGAQ